MVLLAVAGALLAWSAFDYIVIGGTPEVRIDSGDRRSRSGFFTTPEPSLPGREKLIAAAHELGIPARWCAVRRRAPSNPDAGRAFLYTGIAFWLEAEPRLGKIMLKEAADYFENPGSYDSYPKSARFCFGLQRNEQTGRTEINPTFYQDHPDALRAELDEIGYEPDPDGPLARMLKGLSP